MCIDRNVVVTVLTLNYHWWAETISIEHTQTRLLVQHATFLNYLIGGPNVTTIYICSITLTWISLDTKINVQRTWYNMLSDESTDVVLSLTQL